MIRSEIDMSLKQLLQAVIDSTFSQESLDDLAEAIDHNSANKTKTSKKFKALAAINGRLIEDNKKLKKIRRDKEQCNERLNKEVESLNSRITELEQINKPLKASVDMLTAERSVFLRKLKREKANL
jgi:uncharacterized protein (UPF0147 family)